MSENTAVRMDAKDDLSDFCDQECERYALASVMYDAERNEFAATDSKVLAIAKPVEASPTAKDMLIPAAALRRIRRGDPHRDWPFGGVEVSVDAADPQRVELRHIEQTTSVRQLEGRFPKYMACVPTTEPVYRVLVDAGRLLKIARHAKRAGHGGAILEIELRGSDDPIVLKAIDRESQTALGVMFVLMPIEPIALQEV